MRFVAERILPAYLAALSQALTDAADRLPPGRLRRALVRLRRRLGAGGKPQARFAALERLVLIGEAQGWLTVEEAVILRKLGYRIQFLEQWARRPGELREPGEIWLQAWRTASGTTRSPGTDSREVLEARHGAG
ncbi:MAG TPA: hypothetical protein VNJ71_12350 [Gemmatimonadales bacterium]|jgi:hypothetical protein|nr:hypothetical protein [Gemmatimonadales bacterium]